MLVLHLVCSQYEHHVCIIRPQGEVLYSMEDQEKPESSWFSWLKKEGKVTVLCTACDCYIALSVLFQIDDYNTASRLETNAC